MAKMVVSCLMIKTMEDKMESIHPIAKQTIHPMILVFKVHLQVLDKSSLSS